MKSFCRACCAIFILTILVWSEDSADAVFTRGMQAAKAGNLEEAAKVFSTGGRLYPRDVRFPIELAGVKYRQKDVKTAKRWLLHGLKLSPADAYANEFLGTLYQLEGNLPATLKYWNRVDKPFLGGVTFQTDAGLNPEYRARLFRFSAGQVFTVARLDETEGNLRRANILATARIDLLRRPDKQYEAVVDMQPKALPLRGWLGRLLPFVRELPYQAVAFDLYDIAGRGQNFTSLVRWDADKRRVNLQWTAPMHDNPRSEYRIWVDGRDETWDFAGPYDSGPNDVKVHSASGGLNYITGLSGRLQWTVGGSFGRHTFAHNPAVSSFRNIWSATIDNRIDYELWTVPEHRVKVSSWGFIDAGRTFGSNSSRLVISRAGLIGEWLPQATGDQYRLTTQVQSGRIFGTAPADELFQLGMERDTERDLWLRGVLSARDGQKGTGLLGREYVVAQTTLERNLFRIPFVTIALGPFFDVGWAGDPPKGFKSDRSHSYDVGLQTSVRTIGGVVLTLVYGRDLSSGRGAFYSATSH